MNRSAITRRTLLGNLAKGGAAFATVSISARALGLAASQAPGRIVIGTVPVNAVLASYLGAEFFRSEGLDIEVSRHQAGPQVLQGLATGDIAVGDLGLAPIVIALTRGLPVIAPHLSCFSTPDRPFERIIVPADSPIRTLNDLKGKKLGYQGAGTVPDLLLGALPRKSDIRKEDIELVPIPPPNQPAALAQGLVDAIFATPPVDAAAERQFKARTLVDATALVPYAGLAGLVVRRDFAEDHPDAVKRLFKAAIRLARWIRDNEGPARSVAARTLNLPQDLAVQSRLPVFARNGLAVMPNVWHVYEMLAAARTIERHPNPEQLFERTIVEPAHKFVAPALDEVGIVRDQAAEMMLRAEYPLLPGPVTNYHSDWERRLLQT